MPNLDLRFSSGAINAATLSIPQFASSTTSVALSFNRLASGSGTTRVNVGIPLQPGQLTPGGAKRIEISGAEIAATFQESGWLHPDGSVAVLRAQMDRTLTNGTPELATLKLGTAAVLTGPSWVAPTWPTLTGSTYQTAVVMNGVGFPSDPVQLCASRIFGPHIPEANTPATPTYLTGVEQILTDNFDAYYAAHTGSYADSTAPAGGMQYSRGVMCMQKFARTGQLVWLQRALATYAYKRSIYDLPNNWFANEAYAEGHVTSLVEGMFGEEAQLWTGFNFRASIWSGSTRSNWISWGIPMSRLLTDINGTTTPANPTNAPDIGLSARANCYNFDQLSAIIRSGRGATVIIDGLNANQLLPALLARWIDGSAFNVARGNPAKLLNIIPSGSTYVAPFIACTQNFQTGLTICILQDILQWHSALLGTTLAANVQQRIKDMCDGLWAEFRDLSPNPSTLYYTDFNNYAGGRTDVFIAAHGWWATAFYWLFAKSYGTVWRDRGDILMTSLASTPRDGTNGPYVNPSLASTSTASQKNFNQIYQYGYRAIALRQGVV